MRPWMYTVQIITVAFLMASWILYWNSLVGTWYVVHTVLAPFIAMASGFCIGTLRSERDRCCEMIRERKNRNAEPK